MSARRLAASFVCLALFSGCSAEGDNPIPEPDLGSGQSDATDALSLDRALAFGDEFRTEFTGDLQFHGYRFRAGQTAPSRRK